MRLCLAVTPRRLWLAAILAALAACALPPSPSVAPVPPVAPTAAVPATFPAAYYRQAAAQGQLVLQIDPQRSLVTIEVHRAGALARLGHDHVVASHDVQGYVAPQAGRADLYVPLTRLTVDEPPLRAEAHFDTQPSEAAIAGTRRNMLDKVLEAERFPVALIHVERDTAAPSHLIVSINLHGLTRTLAVPAQIEKRPEGMAVSGHLELKQSDFGMTPMAVLGGALQVADGLDLRFRVVAVPL